MKPIRVQNYAAIIPEEEGRKMYEVVTDGNGVEMGITVKGKVTDFAGVNENGYQFDRKSYDAFIAEYFEKNELNIPIDIQHIQDMQHQAGIARKFQKKSDGVYLEAYIPKGVYFYNLIKVALDNGMLQGFSNYGYATDWKYNDDGSVVVTAFNLLSVSLVTTPADVTAKLIANATAFEGFGGKKEEEQQLMDFFE